MTREEAALILRDASAARALGKEVAAFQKDFAAVQAFLWQVMESRDLSTADTPVVVDAPPEQGGGR